MTNLVLAGYANIALYAAMAVFTIAMLAFAVHVAVSLPGVSRQPKRSDTEPVAELALVGASAGEAEEEAAMEAPGRTLHGTSQAGISESPATAPVVDVAVGGGRSASLGMVLSWLGTFLLIASIAMRGWSVSRPPVGNMFEFAVFGSMLAMAVYLGLSLRWPIRWLGLFVVTPVLLTLGLALTLWYTEASELLPSLKSYWLAIHVPVATLSVALFTVGFALLLVQLLRARREEQLAAGETGGRALAFLDSLPTSANLDRAAYSLHIAAFPLWTFSLIAGAIWAQQAWGTYWNWDPKEVWTFVIWVIYAAYLHARATSGWSLRTANILAVLGYLAIIVNFAVVNVYFVGQHSYSGL